jgi:CHAT domain-containing protein/tetratricopeptide (TPR) repeat protein
MTTRSSSRTRPAPGVPDRSPKASRAILDGPGQPRRTWAWARRGDAVVRRLLAAAVSAGLVCGVVSPRSAQASPPEGSDPVADLTAEEAMLLAGYGAEQYEAGNWDVAEQALKVAFLWYLQNRGPTDRETQAVAVMLIESIRKQGREQEAEQLRETFARAMEAKENEHPQRAEIDRLYGELSRSVDLFTEGRLADAAELAQRSIDGLAAILGETNPDLTSSRLLLAPLYSLLAQYDAAETQYLAALKAIESNPPIEIPKYGDTLLSTGTFYELRGDQATAKRYYDDVLKLVRDHGNGQQPGLEARAKAGLSSVARNAERIEEAVRLGDEAVKLARSANLGTSDLVGVLQDQAHNLSQAGRIPESIAIWDEIIAIYVAAFGNDNALVAGAKSGKAWALRSAGKYDEAIRLWQETLPQFQRQLGARSSPVAMRHNQIAEAMWARGDDPTPVIAEARRGAEIDEENLRATLASGSEPQRRLAAANYVQGTERILSYNVRYQPQHIGATELAIDTLLRRKGRVMDAVAGEMRLVRQRVDASKQGVVDELLDVRTRLSTLVFRGPDNDESPEAHAQEIAGLEARERELQKALVDAGALVDDAHIDWRTVQRELPAGSVLVEYAVFRWFNVHYTRYDQAFEGRKVVAYVLRDRGDPVMVNLGDAGLVEAEIGRLRRAASNPKSTDVADAARAVDALLFEPLLPHIGKAEHVLVAPDGALNLVPWAALRSKQGKWRVQTHDVTVVSSGRDLLRMKTKAPPRSGPLVIGNPTYDYGAAATPADGSRAMDLGSITFRPLPGTDEETREVTKTLPEAELVVGTDATERALKQAQGPNILHVATHGFFLADSGGADGARGLDFDPGGGSSGRPLPENPMLRSGLALAGANTRGDGVDDGIATALELSSLDLWGTALVVFSACQTGLGDVFDGEGVYGMRRSVVIAGAQTQVMSLWQVDDFATRDLMIRFYKLLDKGKGRGASLRDAQLKVLDDKRTSHPYYWAAFTLTGDWRALEEGLKAPKRREPKARRDRPRRDWGGGDRKLIREYAWKKGEPIAWLGFDVHRPFPRSYEGGAIEPERGFDVVFGISDRPHFIGELVYSRTRDVVRNAGDAKATLSHLGFKFGFDLIARRQDALFRPMLVLFTEAGGHLGNARVTVTDEFGNSSRERRSLLGGGVQFGVDAALSFIIGRKVILAVRGSLSKPFWVVQDGGENVPWVNEVHNQFRWSAGAYVGFPIGR